MKVDKLWTPQNCVPIQCNRTDSENGSLGRTATLESQRREHGQKYFNTKITVVKEGQGQD